MTHAEISALGNARRRAAAARRRHEKWAAEMRDYGWDCTPPAVENTPTTTTTESEHP